ncbi:MAG: class I SAM-dependent methyltransferase [Elainellaceae cyanobacterium]
MQTQASSWNAALYETRHSFIWQYGEPLLELLAPQLGERILDLGCGTGQLTQKIAETGAEVIGLDADATMLNRAQQNYPNLEFVHADARSFSLDRPVDAVFSNATLHWVQQPGAAIQSIYQVLKPGGRFVAEFGGKGNVQFILRGLYQVLQEIGHSPEALNPWYFPSVGEYASLLEQQGFDVTYAALIDRPTPLEGEAGIANWLQMFAGSFLAVIPETERSALISAIETQLRPILYQEGKWIADYRRIRVVAIKS